MLNGKSREPKERASRERRHPIFLVLPGSKRPRRSRKAKGWNRSNNRKLAKLELLHVHGP